MVGSKMFCRKFVGNWFNFSPGPVYSKIKCSRLKSCEIETDLCSPVDPSPRRYEWIGPTAGEIKSIATQPSQIVISCWFKSCPLTPGTEGGLISPHSTIHH